MMTVSAGRLTSLRRTWERREERVMARSSDELKKVVCSAEGAERERGRKKAEERRPRWRASERRERDSCEGARQESIRAMLGMREGVSADSSCWECADESGTVISDADSSNRAAREVSVMRRRCSQRSNDNSCS